jgi:hypothetical protein
MNYQELMSLVIKTVLKKLKSPEMWLWIFFYLFIFSLLLYGSFQSLDHDYAWHFKFGQDIWHSGQLPRDQIHMWTLSGQSWVDHEWLGNLILYGLVTSLGYIGTSICFALLIVAILILLTLDTKRQNPQGLYLIMLWQLLAVIAIIGHTGVRIQEFGLLCFTTLIISLHRHWSRVNLLTLSFWLALLFWIWACLHASFVMGLIVIYLFLLCRLIIHRSWPALGDWSLAVLPLLATLVTPYGWKLYGLLAEYRHSAYMSQIGEWSAMLRFPIQYWKLLFLVLFTSTLIIFLINRPKLRFREQLFAGSLLILLLGFSFKSGRHFQLFVVASQVTLLPLILNESTSWLRPRLQKWIQFFLMITLLCLSLYFLSLTKFTNDPLNASCHKFPCQAVSWLRTHPEYQQLRLLNHYNWGGYLIGTLPEWRLFIDGRLPQKMFNGKTIIEEFALISSQDHCAEKLAEHRIELVLWPLKQPIYNLNFIDRWLGFQDGDINRPANYLKFYLEQSPDWMKLYSDSTAVIYLRQTNN